MIERWELSPDDLYFLLYHVGDILSIDKNENCGEVFGKSVKIIDKNDNV